MSLRSQRLDDKVSAQSLNMAGETGGDREGLPPPPRVPLIRFPYIYQGTLYITKMGPFTSLGLFSSNCNNCIGGFGPFEILGDPFPRGPPRPSPPPLESFLRLVAKSMFEICNNWCLLNLMNEENSLKMTQYSMALTRVGSAHMDHALSIRHGVRDPLRLTERWLRWSGSHWPFEAL